MNRLQSELHRLYLPLAPAPAEGAAQPSALVDAANQVRAMVIELARPPSWELLSRVWRGVQTELALPAPAIAVSGTDGLQLWFSLAEPIAVAQAHAFLEGLRSRFLPDVEPGRVGLMPAADASAQYPECHAAQVPALQAATGNWSAFVAPDLAPVFADTPWLDIPPNEEGQATLLRCLEVTKRDAFEAASKRLEPRTPPPSSTDAVTTANVDASLAEAPSPTAIAAQDPKRFLIRVMNDESVSLALRIEAAKALLQHTNDQPSSQGADASRNRA
jgi:hypothetical protein